ncbi:MAG: adenine phosphoribosyltransferase [Clostridia bacterium]
MRIVKNMLNEYIPIRTEFNFPKKGVEFIDITPVLMDSSIYNKIIDKFVEELKFRQIDYIVSPEARGFYFGCPIALKLNCGFIPVRKADKLPPTTIISTMKYTKEYAEDTLCLPKLNAKEYKDKRFYIIDDIYATGNTNNIIKKNIEQLGGFVIGTGVLINILELNNTKEIFSIMDINESLN